MPDDRTLVHVHHVGGRDGSGPLPIPTALIDEFALYGYEADEDCLGQMTAVAQKNVNRYTPRPALIGDGNGPATFHINYDPNTNSLLETASDLGDLYTFTPHNGDYLAVDGRGTVERRIIDTLSIDQVVRKFGDPIDVLTLDAEGAEYDLLSAAKLTLDTRVLGVVCEIFLLPVHETPRLFGDVAQFMLQHDFRFMALSLHHNREWSWHRAPIGWRGAGTVMNGDAVFLKDPSVLAATHAEPALALAKLALTALCLGYVETTLECLEVANARRLALPEGDRKYLRMLAEIDDAHRSAPKVYPPKFSQFLTVAESRDRYSADREISDLSRIDPSAVRNRYFAEQDPREFISAVAAVFGSKPLPLESILLKYGLKSIADDVRNRAQVQLRSMLQRLGFLTEDSTTLDLTAIARTLGVDRISEPIAP